MKSLNQAQLIGYLGSDPEFKETDGKMMAKFSVATNDEWIDKVTTEKHTNTEWHKVVCFNKLAEIASLHLKKGMRIHLSGKLKTSKWQGKNNENRYTTEIVTNELIILDSISK